MILSKQDGSLLLITQGDHARLASEILALWTADNLPRHPRREQLLLAVREHDNGWRELDAAPLIDPETGRPHDFRTVHQTLRLEIWRRGIERLALQDTYAALLLAHHAFELHRSRSGEAWKEFLAEVGERKKELNQSAGIDEAEVRRDYGFLELVDLLSLIACEASDSRGELGGYAFSAREREILLEPFPLAGSTSFSVPSRCLPDRHFENGVDLVSELAGAPWQKTTVGLAPLYT